MSNGFFYNWCWLKYFVISRLATSQTLEQQRYSGDGDEENTFQMENTGINSLRTVLMKGMWGARIVYDNGTFKLRF